MEKRLIHPLSATSDSHSDMFNVKYIAFIITENIKRKGNVMNLKLCIYKKNSNKNVHIFWDYSEIYSEGFERSLKATALATKFFRETTKWFSENFRSFG